MKLLLAIPTTGAIHPEIMLNIFNQKRPKDLKVNFAYTDGAWIAQARNGLAEHTIKLDCDWLWFVDSDTIPPTDALQKMLALADKSNADIICPPVKDRNGEPRIALFDKDFNDILEIREDCEIGYGGMSCTLIKRRVLDCLFKKYSKPFEWGVLSNGHNTGEDIMFCHRAKMEGFKIWGIHDVRPKHKGQPQFYQYKPDDLSKGGIAINYNGELKNISVNAN